MYNRRFVECFPMEALPVLYFCDNADCFYYDSLMKTSEVTWKDVWDGNAGDLTLQPHCPSCGFESVRYVEDGTP